MNNTNKKGDFKGLLPLLIFLAIYVVFGLVKGNFNTLPLLVGIVIATFIGIFMTPSQNVLKENGLTKKLNMQDRLMLFCEGGGEKTLIMMVVIFIMVGGFYGVAEYAGSVSSVTNLGLSLLPSHLILPGLFLIGCLLSFSMGTSMGTVAALAPVAIDIANKTGGSMPMLLGVVVGSAMFGDNLSFISDTVIASVQTQSVTLKEKFLPNFILILPAVIINVVLLVLNPLSGADLLDKSQYTYSLPALLPYILVIISALAGLNIVLVFLIGMASAATVGIAQGSFDFFKVFAIIQEGMGWMQNVSIIAIFVGGVVALMKYLGGMDWLLNKMTANVKGRKGGEFTIATLPILLGFATTNNTIAVITSGPIAVDIGNQYGIPRIKRAVLLSVACCATQGLLPHAGQLLVASGLGGISPLAIIPYVWYQFLMVASLIVFIVLDVPKVKKNSTLEAN